jgi:hypothetical protein
LDIQVKEKLYEGYERSSVRVSYFKNASGSAEVLDEIDEGDSPIP